MADAAGADRTALDPSAVAVQVTGVTLDSRSVRPGDLYAALPGARAHGADFAAAVQASGAVAVVTDLEGARRLVDQGCTLPAVVVADPRAVLGAVSAQVYGSPARDLQLIGVTGTNGKTTTTYLLDAVLRAAGRTTGLVGTVEIRVADQRVPSVRTTPEAPELHGLLAAMRERGVDVCSMEVSSQALAQHRVDGAVYDVAAFTNFSQDHLELHGDMASYLAAKVLLLTPEHSREAVVVIDDEGSRTAAARATVPVTTLSSAAGSDADWYVVDRNPTAAGTDFVLQHAANGQRLALHCPLPGDFNVTNAALAAVVLLRAGLSAREVADGLAAAGGVPGRMEWVGPAGAGPLAVVDYAHTPRAVAAALAALRPGTTGRLVVVLGAGGDRDPGKRGPMGAAAALGADVVVVTDDNPRSEDPAAIRAAVLAGAREAAAGSGAEVLEVPDRREAIRRAVARTGPGDVLLVAGKGHETGQEVAGVLHPFDDRDELRAALADVRPTPEPSR
ncbi:MAG TPA: UDP-N-acetylmuramoyl-L-alanyl-D-glutamate--2,6-diaminopimelate ligase [Actinomycetales bacterium]|nr:UDP-N-acetylmuramoyl-L-alanyl-D-glutamate--2,6-diaminopimelate ligase [Actinomycetales bacterium]